MRLLLCLIILAVLFSGCNIINPKEQEPAYLKIDAFEFNAIAGEGTISQKITELWVYADEKVIGVYDLPAMIPILNQGTTDLRIFAGIKNNGLSTMRIRYPFFAPFDTTINIQGGAIYDFTPRFGYFSGVSFSQKGFESGNYLIPMGTNNGAFNVITDNSIVFEGNRSGIGTIGDGQSHLYFKDDDNMILPSGNTYFLEMNYSCNNKFSVGLLSQTGVTQKKNLAVIMNPTTVGTGNPVWNKIYIDLGLIPQQNASANYFEMYFEAVPDASGQPVEIYLDNLKFVKWE